MTIGIIAGYYRGWADTALSRLMDVMLAFPVLLLALGLGAACSFGDGCNIEGRPVGWLLGRDLGRDRARRADRRR